MSNLEEFTQSAMETLTWSDSDDEISAGEYEIDAETELDFEADCRSWWRRFGCFVEACKEHTPGQAGHDFVLTRNGHGAGFWDGDWRDTPYANMFENGSKAYGEFNLYLGDDGKIYAST